MSNNIMFIEGCKVEVKKGISSKSNKDYVLISLIFPNGYKVSIFPNYDQQFILKEYIDKDKPNGK